MSHTMSNTINTRTLANLTECLLRLFGMLVDYLHVTYACWCIRSVQRTNKHACHERIQKPVYNVVNGVVYLD